MGLFVFIPHITRHISHASVARCAVVARSIPALITLAKIFVQESVIQIVVHHNRYLHALLAFVVQVVPDDASIAHHAVRGNWQT